MTDRVTTFARKALQNHLIRFFFVSGLNTVFGYSVFVLLIAIGLHYSLAVLIGTILGILFNFKTLGTLVFSNRNNRLIIKFFMVYGVTYMINVGCLALLKQTGLDLYLAGAILLVPVGLIAYYLNKTLVFNK